MMDALDIKQCKVLRKLAEGELFIADGEKQTDKDSGIARLKGKASRDGTESWVTLKGNAGTVYAEVSKKHYNITKEVPLLKGFKSQTAEEARMLAVDEIVEVSEQKAEKLEPVVKVKGRALRDGAVGWIALRPNGVKAWTPYYKVVATVAMRKEQEATSEEIRALAAGETVEIVDGPVELAAEGDKKALQIKGRAEKDGAIGWVVVRDASGKTLLDN